MKISQNPDTILKAAAGSDAKVSKRKYPAGILLAVIIAAIIAIPLSYFYVQHLSTSAERIGGNWYCMQEDVRYAFLEDGTFAAEKGQITLLSGTWKAGWQIDTIEITFDSEGNSYKKKTAYELSDEEKKLELSDIDNGLTMFRLPDT